MRVYFAGDLFNAKDLIGNLLIAQHIEIASHGAIDVVLPQDTQVDGAVTAVAIRDKDYSSVASCDAAIFNFDGSELDSGTVRHNI